MPVGWSPPEKNSVLFIDTPAENNLVLDFPKYVDTLSDMIEKSIPKFNVGIFGGWGTGKTTLMLNIENKLHDKKIKTLRFNAWMYQNETSHATIPLMLSIITNLAQREEIKKIWEIPVKETQNNNREFRETWQEKINRILKGLSLNVKFGVPGLAEIGIGYKKPREEKIEPEKAHALIEIERANLQKTTLQEGRELIESLLKNVKGSDDDLKLVVFIDDLDRCTPDKAIEVFESIKIFFDMNGVVFVLGLSNEIVELAIGEKYKFLESQFNGEDYLKKIIQLPFSIPVWQQKDIENYLNELFKAYKHEKYKAIFTKENNKRLILQAVERNPREVKRFLNHYIIAHEIYGNETGIKENELLAVQAIRLRWNWFFNMIFNHEPDFLQRLSDVYLKIDELTTKNALNATPEELKDRSRQTKKNVAFKKIAELKSDSSFRRILENDDLRQFLKNEGRIIFDIPEDKWPLYRRSGVSEVKLEEKIPKMDISKGVPKVRDLLQYYNHLLEKKDLDPKEREYIEDRKNKLRESKNLFPENYA